MPVTSIVSGVKALVPLLIGILLAYAAVTVWGWRNDSTQLALLVPEYTAMVQERDDKAAQVTELTAEVAELKATIAELKVGIAEQNHAIALAEERARSAEQQQALAKANAAQQAKQKDRRIATLEQALADTTQTISDLLDKSWELHHETL